MPRVSRKQAELNREIIVEAATRLFRERGIHGISVSDVMAAAGLTHGGFYGHFESREALATEACNRAFEQSSERWQARVEQSPDPEAARLALIDPYLSAANRDNPGDSCPVAAFAGEMCHEAADSALQRSFIRGFEASMGILAATQATGTPEGDRQAAIAQYAMMVGALTLARATKGNGLSDEFLAAARNLLIPEKNLG
ncbi:MULTISPECIES: TetR/AcrR family transcriptional regulator [unclassified Pseudomonas]|jgi:TetR/AcrR family transcriptional repressor of nem operon|uniref:TetR/AcrR family transcriptional regulator n=1 Tax=unclassified Pseudomonas TaxID=196821 RepID=UPI0015A1B5D2|nr:MULTISPECIES: TetR/AcrR family transcriptional regulator [unclassified Pseudomonas]NVZ12278.1 TetR/AcrR family transcriptional regulator [Pseudomonas sp. IPO3775]NVZ35728.1 TetR/AcrR family transcriptional regulator [Pseudomonas sp. A4002]NWA75324.1 TetR/AcrR family transcriptional regulator [Pseudomonas sp. C8002]NWB09664.1 TetR/AcrR family transcriptional regulator [Pseudomonas sp. D5002]NWB22978.1 TetR/AcrR family transcriptional regulator [Pseudomonas sp. D4002]